MISYLNYDDKTWVCDIETDGLNATLVWVVCCENMVTGEEVTLIGRDDIYAWFDGKRREGCIFVFHNGLHFDGPVLNALVDTTLSVACIKDTMVISMLYNPSLPGGHSLDAWGERLKFPKIQHDDWGHLSQAMIDRCIGDVKLTKKLYEWQCRKMQSIGFSERSIHLEHQTWALIRQQKLNGFYFDIDRAGPFYKELMITGWSLREELALFFPPTLQLIHTYKMARKADGEFGKGYLSHRDIFEKLVLLEDGGYEAWGYVDFDPASPTDRVAKLLALGWVPLEFTKPSKTHPNGQPQPTRKGKLSPSLVAFVEDQVEDTGVKTLADWLTVNSRAAMIKTWMNSYNPETHCIHGTLWLANTLRYKHSGPNTANAPAVKEGEEKDENGTVVKKWPLMGKDGGWAYESRDLWTTRDNQNRRLVGVDAKGIQLRVLANYLNDPDFTEAILSEDPHAANARMMDLPGRGLAKTITYAIIMGAGDARIALEARIPLRDAKDNKKKFFDKVPGLRELISRLKAERKRTGRITLCDGSRILCEQDHTVIPFLLQGDESRIMRKAKVIINQMVRKQGVDALIVGDIHDELQCDVAKGDVEVFQQICNTAFKEAGVFFNYKLPIGCDSKVGLTWSQTH